MNKVRELINNIEEIQGPLRFRRINPRDLIDMDLVTPATKIAQIKVDSSWPEKGVEVVFIIRNETEIEVRDKIGINTFLLSGLKDFNQVDRIIDKINEPIKVSQLKKLGFRLS